MSYDNEQKSSSFRHKIKPSLCFIYPSAAYNDISSVDRPRQSPTTWIRSRSHNLPEDFKVKCSSLLSRLGRANRRANNRTPDFRCDPMSYALNFDEDVPIGNFTARLRSSPVISGRVNRRR